MNNPVTRLHDVSITGDADRAAVVAAIELAVAQAASSGTPTSEAVRAAVRRSVAGAVTQESHS